MWGWVTLGLGMSNFDLRVALVLISVEQDWKVLVQTRQLVLGKYSISQV